MTTKHTPGPFPLTIQGRGPFIIATNQGNHYATTHDPEAARLIAAAPDLLAALETLHLAYVEEMLNFYGLAEDSLSDLDMEPEERAAIDRARAAIAKARGEG